MQLHELPTPCYVIDEGKLEENLRILKKVQDDTGCKILLAQKAFSAFAVYPLIRKYLAGTTASGLYEAKLGYEEMGGEVHVFSPAYRDRDFEEIAEVCCHIIFNSFRQLEKFRDRCPKASIGLRLNPMCSTQGDHAIYDPCAPGSRLGVTLEALEAAVAAAAANLSCANTSTAVMSGEANISKAAIAGADTHGVILSCKTIISETAVSADSDLLISDLTCADQEAIRAALRGVEGLHFHTLCEQNSDDLETTMKAVEEQFGKYLKLPQIKWVNMGGGHHITRADYDIERLERCIRHMQETYNVQVYLEPGEAIALNAGYLITEVLDIAENSGIRTLILDASASCHMPDVLEMPYRPPLKDSGEAGEKAFTYRLSSNTCLAGDIIGDYSFDHEIQIGDKLYFQDMAIYSMVKNNTFNGIPLPDIDAMDANGKCRILKSFGYKDFKERLS